MTDAVAGELAFHAFAISAGEFAVGHPDVGVGGVDNRAMAGFTIPEDNLSHVRKLALEGIRQVQGYGLMFSPEGGQRFAQVGIKKV